MTEFKIYVDPYYKKACEIGRLVSEKNIAYGDSFNNSAKILEVFYPQGVPVPGYKDMLGIVRVLDKLSRIATARDAFGESPWDDIAGYAILGSVNKERVVPRIEGACCCDGTCEAAKKANAED